MPIKTRPQDWGRMGMAWPAPTPAVGPATVSSARPSDVCVCQLERLDDQHAAIHALLDPKFRVTRAQRSWPCALCATTDRGCSTGVCSQRSLPPSAASTFPPSPALSTPKVLTGSGRPSLGYQDVDTRSTIMACPQAHGSLQEDDRLSRICMCPVICSAVRPFRDSEGGLEAFEV
ncbi:hypothetical protein INS49_006741 [Diaporthe citri]|uniref:uncharacterized protein n=1 Tax=Diaporthe citri TaxID=83186 RepID=UPI001C811BD7|nr:uncharacterized protein INS49_006741 [Diaporthe citri]KAG6365134.1 hypothetical protein INS49_006741 [Diaporthe citri]